MRDYGLSASTIELMQRARLFKDPTVGRLYSTSQTTIDRSFIPIGTAESVRDLSTHCLRCGSLEWQSLQNMAPSQIQSQSGCEETVGIRLQYVLRQSTETSSSPIETFHRSGSNTIGKDISPKSSAKDFFLTLQLIKRSGQYVTDLVNMDEKQVNVFKQVGPIVNNINELLKHVQRLDQQSDTSGNQCFVAREGRCENPIFQY